MKDEFIVLRPAILLSAATFMVGLVLHVCQQTAQQRAAFRAFPSIAATNRMAASVTVVRTFPASSLPAATAGLAAPPPP
jgi:hypothetical protein